MPLSAYLPGDGFEKLIPYIDVLAAPSVELIFVVEMDLTVAAGFLRNAAGVDEELRINSSDAALINTTDVLELN